MGIGGGDGTLTCHADFLQDELESGPLRAAPGVCMKINRAASFSSLRSGQSKLTRTA
jgi:hypothetical protein